MLKIALFRICHLNICYQEWLVIQMKVKYSFMNGLETRALIDTGSMVTCMSEKFYQSLQCKPKLHDIEDFELKVVSADGNSLPFSDYVEVELLIPFLSMNPIYVPVLVQMNGN